MVNQNIEMHHPLNDEGYVHGGGAVGIGIRIQFQDGPFRDAGGEGEQTGALIEDLLRIVKDRLKAFQQTPSNCMENSYAIDATERAISWLNVRRADRIEREVIGQYAP